MTDDTLRDGEPAPERSIGDVLAGRIRFRLALRPYVLRVLTIGENEDWLERLDAALLPIMSGPDEGLADRLLEFSNELLTFLYAYDVDHVLPELTEEFRRSVYPHEALKAVMEVRLAANPTLGLRLAGAFGEVSRTVRVTSAPSRPTSSWLRRMAGRWPPSVN